MNYAELELTLSRRDGDRYAAELRFSQPGSDADIRLMRDAALIRLDHAALAALASDPAEYGRLLGQTLFADEALRRGFDSARAGAATLDAPLRLRLFVGDSAPELHALRWETLRLPDDDAGIVTSERLLFSRYLSSGDWRPIKLRPKSDLRAVALIANPADLARYRLAPVDVEGEASRFGTALAGQMPLAVLGRAPGGATTPALVDAARRGCDILYIAAHGALIDGEPWLWLEDEAGATVRLSGTDLAQQLAELTERPRLIVLASCQSAGNGEGPALAALGPRLAEAGVPAVLAMQGNISMATVERFMPAFFKELLRDGVVDRAAAAARAAVRGNDDAWMPVLFMRSKSGRIWYVPSFADDNRGRGDEKWEPLLATISDEECTAILGPDLADGVFGPRREVSRRLAEDFNFPLSPNDRDQLPEVAQYLGVRKSIQFLPRTVMQYLADEIRRRHAEALPEELRAAPQGGSRRELTQRFERLIESAWRAQVAADPAEPHRVLAGLPLPIFLSADPSSLLTTALRDAGKDPQEVLCPWNDFCRQAPSVYKSEPDYEPEPARPLVYKLFGRFSDPESLVLTEDDFFDYLIGITRNKDLIPARVRSALSDTALLFLGFHVDDWYFRSFFRSLMSQEGGNRRSRYAHLAVQVGPDEERTIAPALAQRYFEDYFIKGADISVYWGSSEDFIRELDRRWKDW